MSETEKMQQAAPDKGKKKKDDKKKGNQQQAGKVKCHYEIGIFHGTLNFMDPLNTVNWVLFMKF